MAKVSDAAAAADETPEATAAEPEYPAELLDSAKIEENRLKLLDEAEAANAARGHAKPEQTEG